MASRAGVFTSEKPTPMLSPVTASAALPVFVGTAPINQRYTKSEVLSGKGLEPFLAFSFEEAVGRIGYMGAVELAAGRSVFEHTLSEAIAVQFGLYGAGPVVLINVSGSNPNDIAPISAVSVTLVDGRLNEEDATLLSSVFLETLVVKSSDGTDTYAEGTDYVTSFSSEGRLILSLIDGGGIGPDDELTISGDALQSSPTDSDIIGGVDSVTGRKTGLELVSEVFPRFGLIPGLVVVPFYSGKFPAVAAVMLAKSQNINGVFRSMSIVELHAEDGYTSAPDEKIAMNAFDPQQICTYGFPALGGVVNTFSTHLSGLIGRTDGENGDIPYVNPLNKQLAMNESLTLRGSGVIPINIVVEPEFLGLNEANFLLGRGIMPALNFQGGWRAWGVNTAAYPSNTDPKDSSISNRRMFNWVENSIILTCWQFVGRPMGLPLIQTITDTLNSWFDGLRNSGAIAGGRVEFREASNPTTDLLANRITFDVFVTPTPTAAEINFPVTYDPSYLQFGE